MKTIKVAAVKLIDSNGNERTVNMVLDKATKDWLAEIQQKGDAVLNSIPKDYTELSENTFRLADSIAEIEKRLKSSSIEDAELHLGLYIDENGDICQKED